MSLSGRTPWFLTAIHFVFSLLAHQEVLCFLRPTHFTWEYDCFTWLFFSNRLSLLETLADPLVKFSQTECRHVKKQMFDLTTFPISHTGYCPIRISCTPGILFSDSMSPIQLIKSSFFFWSRFLLWTRPNIFTVSFMVLRTNWFLLCSFLVR